MPTEIKTPEFPESTKSAEITNIYVNQGQFVESDDVLFDVETDKVVLEVVAPGNGVIEELNIAHGVYDVL